MAINTLAFNTKLSEELEKKLVQDAQTGFFADNAMRAKFVGAQTVKIPNVDMNGLGDYDRDEGFPQGAITVSSTAYTLTQDRGRKFQLDREDEDETGVAGLAGKVLGEFVRTQVAPEVDAYVLSKLATTAVTNSHIITAPSGGTVATKIYSMLTDAFNNVQAEAGYNEPLVCFVNPTVYGYLMSTTEATRNISISDFKKGGIDFKVKTLNDVPILPVADARMKTAFTFYDGVTDTSASSGVNQKPGGFVPASNANSVGFLVLPKKAAMLVKKSEKLRTFTPEQNQSADAYLFQYRLYYDCFVKNAYKDTIYVYKY